MNKKHLIYIIPICLIMGFMIGSVFMVTEQILFEERHPVVGCIRELDKVLPSPEFNQKHNLTDYAERRCFERLEDVKCNQQ